MKKHKVTDAIASDDPQTREWKTRFAAAKGAYEMGEFRQCASLLFRLQEQARTLKESIFAINTCRIALGAVYLATEKIEQARDELQNVIRELSGTNEAALLELLAVAHRFYAEAVRANGDTQSAESHLRIALEVLEPLGAGCAVPIAYTLSDLASLYITQDKLAEAKDLMFEAMGLLEKSVGSDDPEYIRASLIYNICDAKGEKEMLSQVEDGIFRLQYQFGNKHPSVTRAVCWYLKRLQELGETEKIKEVSERFDVHVKALRT